MILLPGKYAILNKNGSFRSVINVTTAVQSKDGRSLPIVDIPKPSFNPAVEKVTQDGWTLRASDAVPTWKVVALTADELTAIKVSQDIQTDKGDIDALKVFLPDFEAKTASPALQAEAIRLLLRSKIRITDNPALNVSLEAELI